MEQVDEDVSRTRRSASLTVALGTSAALLRSIRERVWPDLEMQHFTGGSFTSLAVEWRAGAPSGPEAFSFPAGFGIVEAAVHAFGEESERIGDAQDNEFSVNQSDE